MKQLSMYAVIVLASGLNAETFTDYQGGVEWSCSILDESAKTVEISHGASWPSGELEIPATVTNVSGSEYRVVRIAEGGVRCDGSVTGITIPDSVVSIGDEAFDGSGSVTHVNMGNSLRDIGYAAFRHCESLASVTIPDTVTNIAGRAFSGCAELMSVVIGTGVANIGEDAFSYCGALKRITLPDSLLTIGAGALYECTNLTSVVIPASVTTIGMNAFSGCSRLSEIVFEGNAPILQDRGWFDGVLGTAYAKHGSTGWGVDIPGTWNGIKIAYAPAKLTIENGILTAVDLNGATDVEIPNTVTGIQANAFADCASLGEIVVPKTVLSIEAGAFSGCTGVTNAMLPFVGTSRASNQPFASMFGSIPGTLRSVSITDDTIIGSQSAFSNCVNLATLNVDGPEAEIGANACANCTNLINLVIGDGVAIIGSQAFRNCLSLSDVVIGSGVTNIILSNIKRSPFFGCSNIKSITIPQLLCKGDMADKSIYKLTSIFNDAVTDESITNVTIRENVEFLGPNLFQNFYSVERVTIPDSVTNIGQSAFTDCYLLKSVTLGAGIQTIGKSAFSIYESSLEEVHISNMAAWCAIDFENKDANPLCNDGAKLYLNGVLVTELNIPNGLATINSYAFYNCSSLQSANIPGSVTNIGVAAFQGCEGLSNIIISEGVTSIGKWAFKGCLSLSNVTMPNGITSIGESAFSGCSSLTNLSVPASVTDFGGGCFDGCPAYERALYASVFGGGASSGGSSDSVVLTVTNVLVVYVTPAAQPATTTPPTTTGLVNIIAEVRADETPVAISSAWTEQYENFEATYGSDFSAALTKLSGKIDTAGNAMQVWQDYVAGTDPTNPNDVFTASITFDEDNKPVIAWSPVLTEAEAAKRKYTTYGKVKLTDKDWTKVSDGEKANYNFFKVTVEMR